ncbi:MAG: hypothetical protein K5682_02750, partial [Lachnospiraceae bacterium]|nr:hypothetical protein [Lachnospiraceae bacterium]
MGEQELKWNDLGFGKMFFDIVMPFLAYYLIHSACYSLIDHLLNHVGYEGGLSAIPAGWATCLNGVSMVVGGVALLFFLKQDDL